MPFGNLTYLVGLIVALLIYSAVGTVFRTLYLLLLSLGFLGYISPESLVILLLVSSLSYACYSGMRGQTNRSLWFFLGVAINLTGLFFFREFSIRESWSISSYSVEYALIAVGISFYSLQNLGVLIKEKLQPSAMTIPFTDFMLFSAFFPKIISGPLLRHENFLPQLSPDRNIDWVPGIQRILFGIVKKTVIADRLAYLVNHNFETVDPTGWNNLIVAHLFALQLYFDFSGYTDIALGSARLFGFKLTENFNFPLRATSITEFWRRWHISLTSWLRDFVYTPVAFGLRGSVLGILLAILITFALSGIWHGLALTFIIYACTHAAYLMGEFLLRDFRMKIKVVVGKSVFNLLGWFLTVNLVSISFLFFRSTSCIDALDRIGHVFSCSNFFPSNWKSGFIYKIAVGGDQQNIFNLSITLALTFTVLLAEKYVYRRLESNKIRVGLMVLFMVSIGLFGVFTDLDKFIYGQF